MGSASFQFLAYALAVAIVFNCGRSLIWRQSLLLAANLGFLAFFSLNLVAFLPLAGFLGFGFLSLRLMQARKTETLVPLLALGIVGFMWLKKYAFFRQ